jgi:PAS domain S-box-containing protein
MWKVLKTKGDLMKKEIELILDSTHDAMIAVNKKGIITVFNKAAGVLTGRNSEIAIGKPIEEMVENTRLLFILKTGISELNQQQQLGDTVIVTNRMPVKNEKDEIIGAIAVFRDISEVLVLAEEITNLKEIQSLMSAIFNSTQDAISVVDQNGNGVLINPAYTRLTGYSEKDIIGRHCTVDLSEGDSVHLQVLATGKPVKSTRIRTGHMKKEVLVEAAPIIVNEELRGSVAVIHDLSEINRLLVELDQAKQIIRNLEAKYTFEDIKGHHKSLYAAVEKARMAAGTPATIILRGESGTGKELFAHAIHNASARKYNQFVRVNCAALTESLLESELFGYEEGAFTGAVKGGRIGLFERADHGTIFMDEIGEVSLTMQSKLLRVLQEKEVVRVGGTKAIPIDVRVISATNVDLEKAVLEGLFRKDLYYRLNVFPILIPPLRERKEDIPELVDFLIKSFNQEYGRNVSDISEEAMEIIYGYDWPGNIRELENFIGRAMINMKIAEKTINSSHMPAVAQMRINKLEKTLDTAYESAIQLGRGFENRKLDDLLAEAEMKIINATLDACKGNREMAAERLGVSVRNFYYKLKKIALEK